MQAQKIVTSLKFQIKEERDGTICVLKTLQHRKSSPLPKHVHLVYLIFEYFIQYIVYEDKTYAFFIKQKSRVTWQVTTTKDSDFLYYVCMYMYVE